MRTLKGQAGAGDLAKVIVTVAVSLIIGLYVFTIMSPALDNIAITNESVGTFQASVASYTLDHSPIAVGTYALSNCTIDGVYANALTEDVNYTLNRDSGIVTNLTDFNGGYMFINYSYGQLTSTEAQTSYGVIGTNSYNAFTLAAIVIIVIAAAAILRNLGVL